MQLAEERSFAIGDKNCFAELSQVTHHMTHMKCDKLQFWLWILSNCRATVRNHRQHNEVEKEARKKVLASPLMDRETEERWADNGTNREGFGDMLSARGQFWK